MDLFANTLENPIILFQIWFEEATLHEPNDPGAMTLATVGNDGAPSARIVLLRSVDENGFGFFTNHLSRKGKEIEHNPNGALCFHWKSLLKQVRVEGIIHNADDQTSDDYFARRARMSQIGAWASLQSQELDSMETLQKRVDEFDKKFARQNIPRPPHWGGYILEPNMIEFWQQRDYRLHERIVYTKTDSIWKTKRLYP